MFWIGLLILSIAFMLWIIVFASLYLEPRRVSKENNVRVEGAIYGAYESSDSWTGDQDEIVKGLSIADMKVLSKLGDCGELSSLDELELYTREDSHVLAERLKKLELQGFVTRSSSGSYTLTEAGRRIVEAYREKAAMRRRDEEIVEWNI